MLPKVRPQCEILNCAIALDDNIDPYVEELVGNISTWHTSDDYDDEGVWKWERFRHYDDRPGADKYPEGSYEHYECLMDLAYKNIDDSVV